MGSWTILYQVGRDLLPNHGGYTRGQASTETRHPPRDFEAEPFECPQCGEASSFAESCFRCGVPLIDGRVDLPGPSVERFLLRRPHRRRARAATLRRQDQSRARSFRRDRKRAGQVGAIADAAAPLAHVRGRIHLVRPVVGPGGESVGAYVHRELVEDRCGCSADCRASATVLVTTSEVGLFLVIDDSGAALVGLAHRLWRLSSLERSLPPDSEGSLVGREGDLVEVVAPARRELGGVAVALPSGYRDGPELLVFRPTLGAPALLFL